MEIPRNNDNNTGKGEKEFSLHITWVDDNNTRKERKRIFTPHAISFVKETGGVIETSKV